LLAPHNVTEKAEGEGNGLREPPPQCIPAMYHQACGTSVVEQRLDPASSGVRILILAMAGSKHSLALATSATRVRATFSMVETWPVTISHKHPFSALRWYAAVNEVGPGVWSWSDFFAVDRSPVLPVQERRQCLRVWDLRTRQELLAVARF